MKKLIWILVILMIGAVAAYFYVFHKPHRDVAGEEAAYVITDDELVQQYLDDEKAANSLYLDQVVAVKGEITEVDGTHIKLSNGVYANLLNDVETASLQTGEMVVLKGRVVGFDALFEEVRLDQCKLAE